MRILVLSDIHGNLPALEIVLKKHKKECDLVISLGDVVNYGPWSNECVDLIETLENKILIIGNHEEYFISGKYESKNISKVFFDFLLPSFRRNEIIRKYKIEYKFEGVIFKHTINNQYIFPDTKLMVYNNYFVGHTHKQMKLESNGFMIINPGSVGQNRTFINLIEYAIFDTTNNSVNFYKVKYNVNLIIDEMKERKYPISCIEYYNSKSRF